MSWCTECMIRNKSSVSEASTLKFMVSFPLNIVRIPRLKALALVQNGWPVSLNRCTICEATEPLSFRVMMAISIPLLLLLVTRAEKRPVSLREFLRVHLDFFWIRNTNLFVSFNCQIVIVEHWHEDDPICEFLRFNVPLFQVIVGLLKNLQWRKSWEDITLEFNCFSTGSQ